MSARLRMGIIGIRGMGDVRAKNILTREDTSITWIAGRDEQLLKDKAKQYNCKYTTDWQELVQKEDVDAVMICAPNTLHYPMGISALEANKHLLVEYPLANSLKEIDELIITAKNRNLILHTGLTARLESQHQVIKQRLSHLGDVLNGFYIADLEYIWKWTSRDEIIGDFFNLANFHFVDQTTDLLGPVEWVNASLNIKKDKDGNNIRVMGCQHLYFLNGASIFTNYGMGVIGKFSFYALYLVGEKGFVWWDGSINFGKLGPDGKKKITEVVDPTTLKPISDSLSKDTENFVEEVLLGKPLKFSAELARYISEVCFVSTESARRGQRILIPLPTFEVRT